jgi:hypothetical protein
MMLTCPYVSIGPGVTEQSTSAYNEFDCVSKCGVQQSSYCLSQRNRQLFRRKGEQRSEWYDGDEVEDELHRWRPVQDTGQNANGHKHQQDIDIVCLQNFPGIV